MIDWDSPNWGGNVHESTTGSWLESDNSDNPDKYDN